MQTKKMFYRTPLNPDAKEKILQVSPNESNGANLNIIYDGQIIGQGWNNNPASYIEEYLRGMAKHKYLIVFYDPTGKLAKQNKTYLKLLEKFSDG